MCNWKTTIRGSVELKTKPSIFAPGSRYTILILLILIFLSGLATLIQAFFFLYFVFPFLRRRKLNNVNAIGKKPKVSVVIAAKNESHNLAALLNSLRHQQYPDYEVIVVLDDTTDNSKEVVSNSYSQAVVLQSSGGKKKALSLAISKASGIIIVLTDADCVPMSHHWIETITAPISSGADVVLGYGRYWSQATWLNQLIRIETLMTAVNYGSFALRKNAYMGVGRNLAYTKSTFESVNGFEGIDHILPGDDDLLVLKFANHHKSIVTEFTYHAQTISIPKSNFGEWLKQKQRHQFSGMYYPLHMKLMLWIQGISTCLLYFTAIILLFTPVWYIGLVVLSAKVLTNIYTAWQGSHIATENLMFWYTPLFEIILLGMKFITSVAIFSTKYTSWK